MKQVDRDNLLIRLDEKVFHIYALGERQEKQLEMMNDRVTKACKGVAINRTRILMIMWGAGLLLGGGGIAGLIILVS